VYYGDVAGSVLGKGKRRGGNGVGGGDPARATGTPPESDKDAGMGHEPSVVLGAKGERKETVLSPIGKKR